jgi:hypothetical protein
MTAAKAIAIFRPAVLATLASSTSADLRDFDTMNQTKTNAPCVNFNLIRQYDERRRFAVDPRQGSSTAATSAAILQKA